MLRLALVVLVACDAGVPADIATKAVETPITKPVVQVVPVVQPSLPAPRNPLAAPATVPSTVTPKLPPHAIATLTGCWRRDASESWTFRRDGKDGLVVVRELDDATYGDRARIPRTVSYDPTSATFGFGAAGRIHGLMMLFQIEDSTLKTSVYTSHTRGSYAWTGSTWTLKRC